MSDQFPLDFSPPSPDEPVAVLALVQANAEQFRQNFAKWLLDNWPIWRAWHAEIDRVRALGRKHYSARDTLGYVRHWTVLREVDGQFKVNNNFSPDMARLYVLLHPEAEDFFEFRERTAA